MRHRKQRTRLGRQSAHRKATVNNMARSVLVHEKIRTTHIKAKEARKLVDSLITIGKVDSLASRRQAFAILKDESLVGKLFKEIAPLFKSKKGGYTRIIPFDFRKGDGASMVFLELTEKKPEEKPKSVKKAKKLGKAEKPKEVQKPKPEVPHAAPEVKPQVKEEKTVEEVKKKKAKDETKKIEKQKGFLKKVKGFFRRKTNM